MDIKEIEKNYHKINKLLAERKIKDALDILFQMIILTHSGDFRSKFESINDTYRNMVKYTVEGIEDPERNRIYNHTSMSVYELTDKVTQTLLTQSSGMQIYRMKMEFEKRMEYAKEEAVEAISGLSFEHELDDILKDSFLSKESADNGKENRDNILANIFNLIWLTDKFTEKDITLIQNIRKSDQITWYEKSIVVSALSLSLTRCFDITKIKLLFEFFESNMDQVWQRAIVGILINLYIYDDRLYLYPEITERLTQLSEHEGTGKIVEMVIIQLLSSRETEKITKKLQEEIIPEVIKITPKLEDKLDIESLMSQDFTDDKNPEWEDFFKDTPDLYEKMEEFTNMQMEGADVFWSAFAMLKHFDFFRTIHNWFLPFHKENRDMLEIVNVEKENLDPEVFMDGISKSAFLCNSDKYSFCLNIQYMPKAQKALLMEFFTAELKNLNELTDEDNMLNKASRDKFIFAQYIQDLYRFFKLHPLKQEFSDIFDQNFDFHNTRFLDNLVGDVSILRNIAEFYFEKDHFESAFEIYKSLSNRGEVSYEIYEKMGYCLQRLKRYDEAVQYYIKAELFDTNRAWLLRKIGLCYRNLNDHNNAIKYYTEALKLDPENQFIQLSIGHCYLSIQQYEEALNYFYKLEYLSNENVKVLRPIAWILFLEGNFESALKYYQRILAEAPNRFDFMNIGHVEWCLGNKHKAVENYQNSIHEKDNTLKQFMDSFKEDQIHLIKHGISSEEIYMVLDHLKYNLGNG